MIASSTFAIKLLTIFGQVILTLLNQFAPLKMAIREITLLKIQLTGKTNMNDFKVFSEYKMSHNVQLSIVKTLYADRWLLDLS